MRTYDSIIINNLVIKLIKLRYKIQYVSWFNRFVVLDTLTYKNIGVIYVSFWN